MFVDTLTDSVVFDEAAGQYAGAVFFSRMSETIATALAEVFAFPRAASDTIGITPLIAETKAQPALASDTAVLADTLSTLRGIVVNELLRIADTGTPAQVSSGLLSELITALDTFAVGYPVSLTETTTITDLLISVRTVLLAEQLGISEVLSPVTTYRLTVLEAATLLAGLTRFVNGQISESLLLQDTLVGRLSAIAMLSDAVMVTPTMSPRFLLRVGLTDGMDITAAGAVTMLFSPVLADGVEITAAYISPGGSFTSWAMNTRTGAVSAYDNFEFNSFAKMGNKYLGASSSGLYELNGDNDAGSSIIARLKGGLMQFGGTHLARLKAAYIATRGAGNFVLKIETGDGAIYNYAVSTRNMRSTKVHMGKGQRARYFSFELISTGGDFDIETLEFVPIVVQRRV